MKKFLVFLAILVFAAAMPVLAQEEVVETQKPTAFVVYSDYRAQGNHFIPSGFMGDYGDIKMSDQSAEDPHSGTHCIKFEYSAKQSQRKGWAGVYWQNPANNWGSKKGGFDLTGMTKLTFWARGAKGGEVLQKVIIGGIKGTYPDSVSIEMGPVELTDTWKQYTVNLAGKNLSYVSGGFGWAITADLNPDGATFYLDDIKYEVDPTLKPESKRQENMPFYIYSDRSSLSNHFIPSGWMGDYGDIKYDGASKEDPYLGDSCIKTIYTGEVKQGAGWIGIYWQNPANNWGSADAGFDLSKATKLTFWARGAKGGERIEELKVGGIMGEYSDSDSAMIGPVILNKDWTQYTIDLKGKDLSYIIGGFCWSTNIESQKPEAKQDDGAIIFYLDEIKYE